MTRTTPPRPADVTAVLPRLAPLARTATRLHPRPGSPSARDSSVGGALLWPAAEPWPHCDGPHELAGVNPAMPLPDVRRGRRIRAAAYGRSLTEQEREALARIRPARSGPMTEPPVPQPYGGSMAMLPVAQLYVRDVPGLRAPEGTDVLQILWCPFDHPPEQYMPRTALFWRSAAEVVDVLSTPPEPPAVQFDGYVPEPCLIDPEQVTEYPDLMELSEESQERLADWNAWQAAGAAPDGSYAPAPQEFYGDALSVAPGWKVGGWASWGLTDPVPQHCRVCGAPMAPLLTIATGEWDDSKQSWIPYEDRTAGHGHPTAVQIGRGYSQQLYVCPTTPEHPHSELMQ
ncbi:hypothetical protein GCM10009850_102540 [Nonomuraea monospora]|uniref:DUF1963 domain-containing protein n=1 Tax=Nonomuraea monospora TaxID=568818 RepID=A0ABN3CZ41_9ACTN